MADGLDSRRNQHKRLTLHLKLVSLIYHVYWHETKG